MDDTMTNIEINHAIEQLLERKKQLIIESAGVFTYNPEINDINEHVKELQTQCTHKNPETDEFNFYESRCVYCGKIM